MSSNEVNPFAELNAIKGELGLIRHLHSELSHNPQQPMPEADLVESERDNLRLIRLRVQELIDSDSEVKLYLLSRVEHHLVGIKNTLIEKIQEELNTHK